jgi:serine/threonine protein kinase
MEESIKGTRCCILESTGSLKVYGSAEFEIPLLMVDVAMAHGRSSGVAVIVIASCSDLADEAQTVGAWVFLCEKERLAHISELLSSQGVIRSDLSAVFRPSSNMGIHAGSGSFAKVVKGELSRFNDTMMRKMVAAKNLDPAKCERADVLREVKMLMAAKGSSHIIEYIGTFQDPDDNAWTILTECVVTGDLFQLLFQMRGKIAEKHTRRITMGLLRAFAHLQDRDVPIIHRDVKCENVLVQSNYDSQLCDFGLACFLNDEEEMRRHCGTPGNVAPEIIARMFPTPNQRREIITEKVDNFGVGVVVAQMVSGHHPFRGSDKEAMMRRNYRCRLDYTTNRWARVHRDVIEVVQALLQRDPCSRASVAQAMQMPWFGQGGQMLLQSLPEVVSGATYRVRRYSSSRSHSPSYKPSKESSATQSTCLTTPRSTFNTQESTSLVTTYRTGDHMIDTDDLQSWFNDVNEVNSLADQSNSFDRTATKPTVEEVPNTPTLQNGAISSCANFFNLDSAVTECTSTLSGEAQVTTTPSAQTKKSMVTDMISHIHKCAEKSPSSFGKRIRGSISKMVKKREHREEKKWMNLVTGSDGSFGSPAPHAKADKFISSPPQVSPVARAKKLAQKFMSSPPRGSQIYPADSIAVSTRSK